MRLDRRIFAFTFSFIVAAPFSLAQVLYDEVVIFDSSEAYDEGLARQRLGLLDEKGRPKVDVNGKLLPLVSQDGKKKAYDQKGGAKVLDALKELKGNGGSVVLLAHGNVGLIWVDNKKEVPGFDGSTGVGGCKEGSIAFPGLGAKTNVDLKMIVCRAGATPVGANKQSVAASFKKEIENQGGTVAAIAASNENCQTTARISYQIAAAPADPDEYFAAIKATSNALSKLDFAGVAIKDHYPTVAALIASKWPAVANPTVSKIEYLGKIPGSPEVKSTTTDFIVDIDFPTMGGGYHHGCTGAGGFVPELSSEGCLVSGNLISIELSKALGGSMGLILLGLQKTHLPAAGGCTLLVGSIVSQIAVPLAPAGPGNGKISLPAMLPTIPGPVSIYLQALVADPTESFGYTMSNGLRLDLQSP